MELRNDKDQARTTSSEELYQSPGDEEWPTGLGKCPGAGSSTCADGRVAEAAGGEAWVLAADFQEVKMTQESTPPMTDIATRAEQAKPEEARGLLLELFDEMHGDDAERYQEGPWPRWDTFRARLDCEAYVDAAMMLIPENMPMWAVTGRNSATVGNRDNPLGWHYAATPALALIAAIARSVE